ncbi:unnamed protein product [Schistocephalus solidus]|uniref:Reverse transcriptase domain-containing protein n=1 Tax=Schistocephalus solidus TaxID=70667 RepID=A0A183SIN5_SCHSO|nr:unnamed protein product [Schistocephalus solidus]
MWRQRKVRQDFKDATIVHLHKWKGNRQLCENHRGISLLNIAGKIFARILLNRLNGHLEQNLLLESQCGFRRHRGTADMIFAARQLQEKCQKMRTHLVAHYELKVRAAMETKYIQKCAEVAMRQTEGRCRNAEKEILEETRFLRNKLAQDTRCHVELFSWLTTRNSELTLTCEYMAEKEIRDVSAKQEELAALTKKKEECLNNLKALIIEYEHVEKTVLADRRKKEKKRKAEERAQKMLDSAQMIQNWWRTMIVTHDIKLKKKRRKDTNKAKKSTKK